MGAFRLVLPMCLVLLATAGANAQTVTLNTGGKQVQITVDEAATMPADFPSDVMLPQPHVLARVERSGKSTTLVLDLAGDVDAIDAEMKADMLAQGWRAAPIAQPATGRARAWEKDSRAVIAWLKASPAGVRLQLQLLPRR